MDQQLKQRLIGTTIAVALVVIFVPMLFEKSDDKGKFATAGIPTIPEDVMEKPLELPKTAEDLAPIEKEKDNKEASKGPAESGYRIVPLIDEAPPKPKAATPAAAKPALDEEAGGDGTTQAEGEGKDNAPAAATPAQKTAQESRPEAAAKPAPGNAPKAATAPKQAAEAKQPSPAAKKPTDTAHAADLDAEDVPVPAPVKVEAAVVKPKPAVKKSNSAAKSETAKSTDTHRPVIKTVKVNKPKPVVTAPEADEEGEPIPAPAPAPAPAEVQAKAKPAAKPADAHSQPAKAVNKLVSPAHVGQATASGAKPKPADAAAKAAPKKPATWVVQAGSFTDESAAHSLAEKLKLSKIPASVRTVQSANGPVFRVQVGAEHDRGHAEETLRQIEKNTGINGIITTHH